MSDAGLTAWLDAQVRAAEGALLTAAGGQSLCQWHKDGRVTGGLKYAEGRLVAWQTVRRLTTGPPAELPALWRAEAERWQAELDRQRAQARPAPAWLAYCQGGCDALAAALTERPE